MASAAPTSPPVSASTKLLEGGSDLTTHGVRVVVRPTFLPQHSQPTERLYVWAYRVTITNTSERTVQLLRRSWRIIDGVGRVGGRLSSGLSQSPASRIRAHRFGAGR